LATSIVMPQMGYDMQQGTVVRWHKQEGDPVARGDVLADIETDKATVEFEAYVGGVLRKIVAQESLDPMKHYLKAFCPEQGQVIRMTLRAGIAPQRRRLNRYPP